MKRESKNYIGTFQNTPEGIQSYKNLIQSMRQIVKGGRFVKMFRGKNRPTHQINGFNGQQYKIYGNQIQKNSTHFDLYLHSRINYSNDITSVPKIGNMIIGFH